MNAFIGLVIQPCAWFIAARRKKRLARTLDARIADFAPGEGEEEALEQEVDALEVLAEFEGSERAHSVVSLMRLKPCPEQYVTPRGGGSNAWTLNDILFSVGLHLADVR